MNIWSVLGIQQTNNEKDIKAAYAKKLKNTRPDEHPADFQSLHQAYKTALSIAKTKNTKLDNVVFNNNAVTEFRVNDEAIDADEKDQHKNYSINKVYNT